MERPLTVETLNRVDDALDRFAVGVASHSEPIVHWLDSYTEVDFRESEEVR